MILFVPFGPRLDRPDAVGDDGRARAEALLVATLVAGAGVGATVSLAGLGASANLAATGTGFCVAGVALFARDRPLVRVGGHLLFLPGLLVALVGVASGVVGPDPFAGVGVTAGVALAVGGGAAAWAGLLGEGEVTDALRQGVLAALVPVAVAVPLLLVAGVVAVLVGSGDGVVVPSGSQPRLAGFALLVGVAAGATRLALSALPLARLVGRDRRGAVEERLARAGGGLTVVAVCGLLGWVGAGLAGAFGLLDGLWESLPSVVVGAVAVATGAAVRVPVAAVGAVALALAGAAVLARRLAGRGGEWLGTTGLPFVGGAVLLAVVAPALVVLVGARADEPVSVGLGLLLVVVATIALSVVAVGCLAAVGTVPLAVWLGLLPARNGGVALLAAGTLAVAGFGGLAGAPAVAVVGTTAAALVAWDLGEFATGLTREAGSRPAVRGLARRHALASVGVGGVGAGAALCVGVVGGAAGVGLRSGAALAVVGVVPLALALRS